MLMFVAERRQERGEGGGEESESVCDVIPVVMFTPKRMTVAVATSSGRGTSMTEQMNTRTTQLHTHALILAHTLPTSHTLTHLVIGPDYTVFLSTCRLCLLAAQFSRHFH